MTIVQSVAKTTLKQTKMIECGYSYKLQILWDAFLSHKKKCYGIIVLFPLIVAPNLINDKEGSPNLRDACNTESKLSLKFETSHKCRLLLWSQSRAMFNHDISKTSQFFNSIKFILLFTYLSLINIGQINAWYSDTGSLRFFYFKVLGELRV